MNYQIILNLVTMTIIGTLIIGQVQGSVGTSDADPSPNNYNHTSHYQNSASEGRKTYNKIPGIPNKKGDELSPGNILNKLDWRNLFTTAMKMFFGNSDDQSKQASRQLVNMIISLVDGLRLSFNMRRSQARSSGESESPTTDAALAGLSMLKAYVKSITSEDEQCIKKYLCQGNREAVRDGNQMGYLIAQFGSYATSYIMESFRYMPFEDNFGAAKEGRSGQNCEELFNHCNELI